MDSGVGRGRDNPTNAQTSQLLRFTTRDFVTYTDGEVVLQLDKGARGPPFPATHPRLPLAFLASATAHPSPRRFVLHLS